MSSDKDSNKSALIIKADTSICGDELTLVESQFRLQSIETITVSVSSLEELEETFDKFRDDDAKFDYFYLCAHGNTGEFGINDIGVPWSQLALLICTRGILSENAMVLLACCKGGFYRVACELMASCLSINAVCGVTWTVLPEDLSAGFTVFVYNIEQKRAEPRYAAEKATLATDFTFKCTTRDDLYESNAYSDIRHLLFYEFGWIDDNGNWISTDTEISSVVDYPVPIISDPA